MPMTTTSTKIVCTIGPASSSPDVLKELIGNGMSVARLNFSHGTRQEHEKTISLIREIADELKRPVAILQDLAGPKIRIGSIREPGIELKGGAEFILTSEMLEGNEERVSVNYSTLPDEVEKGDTILLADGFLELRVREIRGRDIHCRVIVGGHLSSNKGLNLPTGTIKAPALTEKDREDLVMGLRNGVDYIGLSFVRKAEDILMVKDIIEGQKMDTPVIAKIEKHEALDNLDDLLACADGIMVARGDLGVEIPLQEVPLIQKMLIRKANNLGKPVITATQMLRSMVDSPRPTRAEANDVANAVLDGSDALMLSEETAMGSYPVEAVSYMSRIIRSAETRFPHQKYIQMTPMEDMAESVAHAACVLAEHLNASAIIPSTTSGMTAKQISRFRPRSPILALSPNEGIVRRLCLYWGCRPRLLPDPVDTDDMIEKASNTALESGAVSKGDIVIITAGHPLWVPGTTNMVRVKRL